MDIVIVRPKRDPTYVDDGEESRQRFVSKASTILGGAYQQGAHVNLRYKSSGELSTDGDGVTAVEYIRCSGWEWMPVSDTLSRMNALAERLSERAR